MNNYYVYGHFRKDNDDIFYIGKGSGSRMISKERNALHDDIVNKYGMYSKILINHLSEDDAYNLEQEMIRHYVFDLGYGIDIIGLRNSSEHQLANATLGGKSSNGLIHTQEWREQHSKDMMGEKNPMYGVNVWKSYSDEKREQIRQKLSECFSGENNPMYGISPKERMDPETYAKWLKNRPSMAGSNNPNYGNHKLHDRVKDDYELRIKYFSRKGKQNGRCRSIDLLSVDGEFLKHFDYIGECAQYVKEHSNAKGRIDCIRSNIQIFTKKNKPYLGYRYKIY